MNYWKTCIEEAVSELGIQATEQQIKDLAEWVEGSHDNYGMMHGHDCIPNPAETARKEDARRHETEMRKAEERERLLKKNIASRYNTDVWVTVRDGGVEVERAR